MDSITSMAGEVKGLVRLLPEATHEANQTFARLHGIIDVILVMASRLLHCKNGIEAGKLHLNGTIFSPGEGIASSSRESPWEL